MRNSSRYTEGDVSQSCVPCEECKPVRHPVLFECLGFGTGLKLPGFVPESRVYDLGLGLAVRAVVLISESSKIA